MTSILLGFLKVYRVVISALDERNNRLEIGYTRLVSILVIKDSLNPC